MAVNVARQVHEWILLLVDQGRQGHANQVPIADEVAINISIGSEVEVKGMEEHLKYGVVRWLGMYKYKKIVGLEMVG